MIERVPGNCNRSTHRTNIHNSATDVVSRVIDLSKHSHRLLHQERRPPEQSLNFCSCIFFGYTLRITHECIPGIVDDNVQTTILLNGGTDGIDDGFFEGDINLEFEDSRRVVG